MEQTNTPQQPPAKKHPFSAGAAGADLCSGFIFSSHWAEISTALAQLSFWQVLLVLAIGLTYPLLEGIVCCSSSAAACRASPCDAAWMPPLWAPLAMWSAWVPGHAHGVLLSLHCGLPLGPGVGLMTLQYVFHKTTVLLYAL